MVEMLMNKMNECLSNAMVMKQEMLTDMNSMSQKRTRRMKRRRSGSFCLLVLLRLTLLKLLM